jgi:uncharacterized protein (DUF58 family)
MAIPRELYKKLQNYEIRIRKAVNAQMHGDFHSVFKGSGLEFDDVRPYQYGDDVRRIDWNVTAKGHGTFLKTFKEEKEQNVFFIVDVSASQEIGKASAKKIDIAREICGALTLSATKEDSSVGLVCFSDQKEIFVKPNKGARHAYLLINTLFELEPESKKTSIDKAMRFALGNIKRKSIIVVISDFLDEGYEKSLQALARKHDLIVIQIADDRETNLPNLGIIPMFDKERGKTVWVNTSSPGFRKNINAFYLKGREALAALCRRNAVNYLYVNTGEDYVSQLIKLFKIRNQIRK